MATLTEGDSKVFESEMTMEMEKVIKHLEHDLLSIRSGKASAAMVQDLMVDSYGQMTKMKAVATISTPDARLIMIQPWDKKLIAEIAKSIQNSDLGVTPVTDSDHVRVQLPVMSTERREEMVKVLRKKIEDGKIKIRNVRRDYNGDIKDAQQNHEISEDFAKRTSQSLQKITDRFIDLIEQISSKKESELKLV